MTDLQESSHTHNDNETIAVIIVNYRTPALVSKGLQSLEAERQAGKALSVIIIDNCSGDDSIEVLTQFIADNQFDSWVQLVAAPKNGGFAYGNNLGFTKAYNWLGSVDYFWVLNPDTAAMPGATEALLESLRQHPDAIVGSLLQDEDGTKQISAFNYPSLISEACGGFGLGFLDKLFAQQIVPRPIPDVEQQVPWLAGASIMFSSDVEKRLGGMDQKYFLYFEEVDYLLKAKKMGIHCRYVPESRVVHHVGAATGVSDTRKKRSRRPAYWFESRRRYFLKNHGRFYLFLTDALWLAGYGSWLARKSVSAREDVQKEPPRLWWDFLKYSQLNPRNWLLVID